MCLINFQFHDHPNYKLVIAANRDEFYNRPTAAAHFWEDHPNILAGRDLQQMGTWLGITKEGRFAALTNYRDPAHMGTGRNSRGEIVRYYLAGSDTPKQFLTALQEEKGNYVGFNVLVGSQNELFYYNNIENEITEIEKGHTYGLSNHFLNTPWPKVVKGKDQLQAYLEKTSDIDPDSLFLLLQDAEQAPLDELPDTGIGVDLERKLSPLFIHIPQYGTRCSTVVTVDHKDYVTFVERTYHDGKYVGEKKFGFQIV
ncbi:Uncharacterized conserved protein, contains NRDE domain [Oceanobacillus limi]|uniref:Uncharacterized conserved protein, contains NRDE domain n=1 Tax=Oceanobacillus limi TaxID=930131 RepID=A0A1H9YDR0_9BACI|nr:NRDE family protein [Oceanobacillus limi]SES66597.1 Uncharacterized conserved protein, contains NRDE domain [Oceanobacillus limi]